MRKLIISISEAVICLLMMNACERITFDEQMPQYYLNGTCGSRKVSLRWEALIPLMRHVDWAEPEYFEVLISETYPPVYRKLAVVDPWTVLIESLGIYTVDFNKITND